MKECSRLLKAACDGDDGAVEMLITTKYLDVNIANEVSSLTPRSLFPVFGWGKGADVTIADSM